MNPGTETVVPARQETLLGLTRPRPHHGKKPRIGDTIVDLGFTDRATVDEAAELSRETKRPMGRVLMEMGALDSRQLAHALADRNGLDFVNLDTFQADMGAANLIDMAAAKRFRSVPIAFVDDDRLLVATGDPANLFAVDDISMLTGYEIRLAVASPDDIDALVSQLSRLDQSVAEVEEDAEVETPVIELRESAEDAPVVKLVHAIIADAVRRGASDIHFDPRNGDMRVRFRIDGVVVDSTTVPRALVPGLISRTKIMAELDISERRVPQDGRVGFTVESRHVDIRVATLPVVRGESIVMRILDKDQVAIELDRLGMHMDDRDRFHHAVRASHGAVLVTGPTGSGKTTTLYAALNEVNTPDKSILTIEDPVEYELEGLKQVQVNVKAGLTFATGLRSMVRSDPDVIMVGEIRDRETAQIAIESALTGHLVLSTLHTNDAPMAAARLIEMGIEPFLVSSGVACVVAQRLARRLCDCKEPTKISAQALRESGFPAEEGIDAFEPGGCVRCGGSGYRGRIGLYEVMQVTRQIRELVLAKADGSALRAVALEQGMRPLRHDGLEKVGIGVTSVEEILRALGSATG